MPVRERVDKCGDIRIITIVISKSYEYPSSFRANYDAARITLICGADYILLLHNPGLKPGANHIKPRWGFRVRNTDVVISIARGFNPGL